MVGISSLGAVKLEKQTHPGAVGAGAAEFQTISVVHGWSLPSASAAQGSSGQEHTE